MTIRNAEFDALLEAAHEAGYAAGTAEAPTPVGVVQTDVFGNPIEGAQTYTLDDGLCGFAWINIKPGNSKFANYLKKIGAARSDSYYGGVTIWVSLFGQSYDRKIAYARAYANVLKEAGYERVYASGRLD